VIGQLGPLRCAEVTGDARVDLCCADLSTGQLVVFPQGAGGGFDPGERLTLDAGPGITSIEVADLNGDSRRDLIAAVGGTGELVLFQQTAPGVFEPDPGGPLPAGTPDPLRSVAAGDLNGDGLIDLAAGGGALVVHLQEPGGGFTGTPSQVLGGPLTLDTFVAVSIADLDADGRDDVVVADQSREELLSSNRRVHVYFQGLDGRFESTRLEVGEGHTNVVAADLDGDGRTDLVTASGFDSFEGLSVSAHHRDVPGYFGESVVEFGEVPTLGRSNHLHVADVDGDSNRDLVVIRLGSPQANVFQQAGPGVFSALPTLILRARSNARVSAVGDVNTDGLADVLLGTAEGVEVFFQLPDGSFGLGGDSTQSNLTLGTADVFQLAVADLDHDGAQDVAAALDASRDLQLFHQVPSSPGTFAAPVVVGTGVGGEDLGYLAVEDVNADGLPDLVSGREGPVFVFFQRADGSFGPGTGPPDYDLALEDASSGTLRAGPLRVVDLDGDGLPDVAALWPAAGGRCVVWFQGAPGSFPADPAYRTTPFTGGTGLDLADVDRDGRPDLLLANEGGVGVYLQRTPRFFGVEDGSGTGLPDQRFQSPDSSEGHTQLVVSDLDGDGDLDVIAVRRSHDVGDTGPRLNFVFGGR